MPSGGPASVDGGSAEIDDALSLFLGAVGWLGTQPHAPSITLTSDGLDGWRGSAVSAFTTASGPGCADRRGAGRGD